MDLFIMDVKNYSYGPGLTIATTKIPDLGGRRFRYAADVTVAEYRRDAERGPRILGLLDQGSRIQIKDMRAHGFSADKTLTYRYVRAEVLAGEHTGMLVELSHVSNTERFEYGNRFGGPDDLFLTFVEEE